MLSLVTISFVFWFNDLLFLLIMILRISVLSLSRMYEEGRYTCTNNLIITWIMFFILQTANN